MSVSFKKNFKQSAKALTKLLKEEFGIEVSHSRSLHLMARISGHKNWNTAAVSLEEGEQQSGSVADVIKYLSNYDSEESVLVADYYRGAGFCIFKNLECGTIPYGATKPVLVARAETLERLDVPPQQSSRPVSPSFMNYSCEVVRADGSTALVKESASQWLPQAIARGREMLFQNPDIQRVNVIRFDREAKVLAHYLYREGSSIHG